MRKLSQLTSVLGLGLVLVAGLTGAGQACAQDATLMTAPAGVNQARFRAQVTSIAKATVSSEFAGKIEKVHFREGERFKKGEALVTYDCSVARARLARAQAGQEAANGKFKAARELKALNSISVIDFEEARAALLVARAEAQEQAIQVERCTIKAPFTGLVGETFVRAHEYVGEGQKLLTIFDDSSFEVETILPSSALKFLKIGTKLQLKVDETGGVYPVEITRIAGSVDPVSQSIQATGRLLLPKTIDKKTALPLLPGMSGAVSFIDAVPGVVDFNPVTP